MARLEHINPGNVPPYLPYGLSHAVAAEGGRTIYLSGQVGWNAASEPVGPDLACQLAQAHENIRRVLAAAGATVADIVRLNTYVADCRPEDGEIVNAANRALFAPACRRRRRCSASRRSTRPRSAARSRPPPWSADAAPPPDGKRRGPAPYICVQSPTFSKAAAAWMTEASS